MGCFRQPLTLSLKGLAAFRIAFGITVAADVLYRVRDLESHYLPDGVLTPGIALKTAGKILQTLQFLLPHFHVQTYFEVSLLFAFHVVIALAFAAGAFTRVSGWMLLGLNLSLVARSGLALHAGHIYAHSILIIAQFLPINARWSVDASVRKMPVRRESGSELLWSWAYVLQFFLLYAVAGLSKVMDPAWQSLRALEYACAIGFYHHGLCLLPSRWPTIAQIATFLVIFTQFATALLALPWWFLPERRRFQLLMGLLICFHVPSLFFFPIYTFPFYCLSVALAFWPSVSEPASPLRDEAHRVGRLSRAIAVCYLLLMGFNAAVGIAYQRGWVPAGGILRRIHQVTAAPPFQQTWRMFTNLDGALRWAKAPARTRSGRTINLLTNQEKIDPREVPFHFDTIFNRPTWRGLISTLGRYPDLRASMFRYVCLRYRLPDGDQIVRFDIYQLHEVDNQIQEHLLWSHDCEQQR